MLVVVRKRRVWTEFLPPEILAAPATVQLLADYQLQPIIAMPPGAEGPGMAEALRVLCRAGVPVGLWPLLADCEGYWPGAANAALTVARVQELLAFTAAAGVAPQTMALDLEPALAMKRNFASANLGGRARMLAARFRDALGPEDRQEQAEAIALYSQLAAELRAVKIESLAIAVPPLAIDLAAGTEVWQRFFQTPLTGPGWDTQSPMYYRSMIQRALPGDNPMWGQAVFAEACRLWARDSRHACMSLGVVGPGKLADEASYSSPAALAWDVACASEAGLSDLALFSLESVLDRGHPEQWLEAFTGAPERYQVPARERLARGSLRGALSVAAFLTRRF